VIQKKESQGKTGKDKKDKLKRKLGDPGDVCSRKTKTATQHKRM